MSILFAGGTSYQLVPWSGPTLASGNFTVAMRLYATTATLLSDQQMFFLDTSGGATAVLFIDDHGGAGPKNWAGFVTNDAFSIFAQATDPSTLTLNTWYHLAMTWDGTSTRLYVNGALVATNTPAATTRTGNWSNWGAPANFDGAVQDVVTYNAALTVDEIMQLYRARMPLRRTNLVMWLPMLTAPGLDNLSGVGVNAALSGGAPSAGNDLAAVPWGVGISPQAFRLQTITTLTANDVETAGMTATALVAANDVETATMNAAGALAAADVETASLVAVASLNAGGAVSAGMSVSTAMSGGGASSAQMTAVASMAITDRSNASMSASSGGGGGSSNVVVFGGSGRRFGNRLMPALVRRRS